MENWLRVDKVIAMKNCAVFWPTYPVSTLYYWLT